MTLYDLVLWLGGVACGIGLVAGLFWWVMSTGAYGPRF